MSTTTYVKSPGYLTFDQYLHSQSNYTFSNHTTTTWTDLLFKSSVIAESIITFLADWLDFFGSKEALDDFLFTYFFSQKRLLQAAGIAPKTLATTWLNGGAVVFDNEVKHYYNSALSEVSTVRTKMVESGKDFLPVTTHDIAVLILFAMCFRGSVKALYPWLRLDTGYDKFRVAEMLFKGFAPKVVKEILDSDVDGELLDAMSIGGVTS